MKNNSQKGVVNIFAAMAILAIVGVAGFMMVKGSAPVEISGTSNWKTHTNNKYGFKIKYPLHFEEKGNEIYNALDLRIRKDAEKEHGYRSLSINVIENEENETVAQYFARKKIQDTEAFASRCRTCAASDLDAEFDDCMANRADKIEIGGKDAFMCNETPTRGGPSVSRVYVSHNGYIYEFSRFNDGGSENYEENSKILSTFKFTK